jgi:hypothetical protein
MSVGGTLLYAEGQAQLVDMSLGGLGLVPQSERPLAIGDQLDFLISSENARWYGPFSAHVVWSQQRRAGLTSPTPTRNPTHEIARRIALAAGGLRFRAETLRFCRVAVLNRASVVYDRNMRISWRELDWISERDRHEIERRMHVLGGDSGLLDRVDFAGRASGGAGPVEIRITANAAKRQIIAVRRDPQRVRAFNNAFAAMERSVVSVLKTPPAQPRAAAQRATPAPAPRPALALPRPESRLPFFSRRGALAGFALAAVIAIVVLPLSMQGEPRKRASAPEVDVAAPADFATPADVAGPADAGEFSAVANIPVETRVERELAFSAVARLSASER